MAKSQDARLADVSCEVKHETEKAWLIFDGSKEVWVPKSMGDINESRDEITLPEWKAKELGLI